MNSSSILKNAYTDIPSLHSNLVLGSLQILFWLFFRPSVWRNYIAHIDPLLHPNFCLAELNKRQWQNPLLRKFLLQEYLILPLIAALLIGLSLLMLGRTGETIAGGLVSGLVFGLAVSIAVSVTSGIAGGLTSGLSVGLVGGAGGSLVGGVAGGIAIGSVQKLGYSLARQVSGVTVGLLIGSLIALIVVAVSGWAGSTAATIAGGVAGGVAIGLRTDKWRFGLVAGVVAAVIAGLSEDQAGGVATSIAGGVVTSVAGGVVNGVIGGLAGGLTLGLWFSTLFAISYAVAEKVAGPWAGALSGALVSGGFWILSLTNFQLDLTTTSVWLLGLSGLFGGITLSWWRPILLYPIYMTLNTLLYRLDERSLDQRNSFLRYHSAFWDEYQRFPLLGLDEYIVLVAERNPTEARAAISYLSTSRQRWAAQAAQIELDARRLERCVGTADIGQVQQSLTVGELEGPASALFRSFNRISEDVDAALNQSSAYNQRLALSAVSERLDRLLRELARSSDKYAVRFLPIAQRWSDIITQQLDELTKAAELRQEIDSPYIIGVPLTERQEIFVGRADISSRIEQLLLDRRRPPLLLYGQRRTGKTSLLNNLGRLLPNNIIPMFVDLQGPASCASNHAGFLYNIAKSMVDSAKRQRKCILPALTRESLADDPFTRFNQWLDELEFSLRGNTVLLALDEFEVLDQVLTEGRFSEIAVLGMLRNLIQHRSRFKVLLSGSHSIDEFQRWSNYLINVQVLHITYLKEPEARQLIEHPTKDFVLRYEPDASQRVLDLTHGHPYLVQLLCAEIVALKNEQDPSVRRLATLMDVEAAIPEALSSGSMFFSDIERNQVNTNTLPVLRYLAAKGRGATISQDALSKKFPGSWLEAITLSSKRELIESTPIGYRFQVELIRQWFTL